MRLGLSVILAAAVLALAGSAAAAAAAVAPAPACPPSPPIDKPIRLSLCAFSDKDMAYVGSPHEQALCLMPDGDIGHFKPRRSLGAPLDGLIGAPANLDRARLLALLGEDGIAYPADGLKTGVSHAWGGKPYGPPARYFVIHDTSSALGRPYFPPNDDPALNRLGERYCGGDYTAHTFINRQGKVLLAYDYATPWRATKFEHINPWRKGLFLHNELTQPRIPREGESLIDASVAPDPAFTEAQYRSLALLYATASTRAGTWLIPAFHSAIDYAWADGHDDPRDFDLVKFDAALSDVLRQTGAGH
ncbi:MAG TPA: hypothetical protein VIJ94_09510 [Caulobacteraceae bacterium]